ncbi:phosphatase PAP2 family protein [Ligilactobacillus agilis]|uniref:phosphatase PAP2 family protein n=1 Tax=Ligilactobacillus agilis TaxID=1601 RepID=UPI003207E805
MLVTNFDTAIQTLLKPLTNPTNTRIVEFITNLGGPVMATIFSLLVIICVYLKYSTRDAIWALVTLASGNLLVFLVKNLMQRPRPSDKLVAIGGFSFPSGHTFGTTIFILFIVYLLIVHFQSRNVRLSLTCLAAIWALLIALSRIYLHVHYPSDVLASFLLAGFTWQVARMFQPKSSWHTQS